jgi:hypothetical protein
MSKNLNKIHHYPNMESISGSCSLHLLLPFASVTLPEFDRCKLQLTSVLMHLDETCSLQVHIANILQICSRDAHPHKHHA